MLKKITTLFLSVFIIVGIFLPSTTKAQEEWWNPTFDQFSKKVNDADSSEIFGERYTRAQVHWIIASLVDILGGDMVECAVKGGSSEVVDCLKTALGDENGSSSFKMGPILATAGAIDSVQNTRAASGIDYVAGKFEKLSPISTTYAQEGYGFSKSLLPIQKLWVVARNGAYALITVAMVILAFMIMFRAKLDPRTVLTIQAAIPKVIIALLFITFSYAIAGFIVDLAYLVQGITAGIIASGGGLIKTNDINAIGIFNQINRVEVSMVSYGISFLIESFIFGGAFSRLFRVGGLTEPVRFLSFFTPGGGAFTIDVIIALIVLILILIALIRIFWLALKTQVTIFLLVIAGPFFALFGLLNPATNPIFTWMKLIVANLATLLMIGLLVFFAHVMFFGTGNGDDWTTNALNDITNKIPGGESILNPFEIENFAAGGGGGKLPSGYGSEDVGDIGFFVSFVIILAIPGIANNVRSLIQSGRTTPFAFSDSMGMLKGPAERMGRNVSGRVGGAAEEYARTRFGGIGSRGWGRAPRRIRAVRRARRIRRTMSAPATPRP